jgi:hypothetical protein|tara:strand:- start:859 stop:1530 length:672 start_codon:yes stop_codon:yes gene_type:complete
MAWRTTNSTLAQQITNSSQEQFKSMNNLLTLQENHVEEFFYYHGEAFLTAFEKMLEDVIERVLGQMLPKMKFVSGTGGDLEVHPDSLREYETITTENIQLDLQNILGAALNTEVIMQRKMAKEQYLQSQGFNVGQSQQPQQPQQPSNIQGAPAMGGINQQMMQQQMALNNQSGYPVPPAGYDQYNNPYWIDPASGQMTYNPPQSGLGLASAIGKTVAWAKWLA